MAPRAGLRAEIRYIFSVIFGCLTFAGPLALALAIGDRSHLSDLATIALYVLLFLLAAAIFVGFWIVMERGVAADERARAAPLVLPYAALLVVAGLLYGEIVTGAARSRRGPVVTVALVASAIGFGIAALRARRVPPVS